MVQPLLSGVLDRLVHSSTELHRATPQMVSYIMAGKAGLVSVFSGNEIVTPCNN